MAEVATFHPADPECFNKLLERFEFMFERELIDDMCRLGTLRRLQANTTIIEIGELISHMPLVIKGSIKVMTEDADEHELLLYYLEHGDTCAVTLNCCNRKTKSTVRAITEKDTELIMIPVEQMDLWMAKYASWRSFVLESFNIRFNEMLEAIDSLAFDNLETRLYKYLRDKVLVTKESILEISHQQIATELNSSRVVISRLMKKLELDGKIKQHRNKLEVLEFQS